MKKPIWILPEINLENKLRQILAGRGIKDEKKFLNPKLSDLHSSEFLYGTIDASKAIINAVKQGKRIYIHGDFDVDGITASSIMFRFLYYELNADVKVYIPSRFDEGYGLSEESINAIINDGGNLIISVDCGGKDIDLVAKYSESLDFVITDHHTLLPKLALLPNSKIVGDYQISSKALAVVHPLLNDLYPFKSICGAMVSFKCVVQMCKDLALEIDLNKYLDLVALGTVCDVMPLIDENRVVTKFGLDLLNKTENIGLQLLLKESGFESKKIDESIFGFVLGPRINASGRMDKAINAVRLLSTNSTTLAEKISKELSELNKQRQTLTKKYFEEAILQVTDKKIDLILGQDWPEGILGLIAGKLTSHYYKPFLVATNTKEGIIKGSARSIGGINIAFLLKDLDKVLLKHGGHMLAGGFSLDIKNLEKFQIKLDKLAKNINDESIFIPKLKIDAELDERNLNVDFVEGFTLMAPFGNENPKPVFLLKNSRIEKISFMGENSKHVKILGKLETKYLEILKFNFDNELIKGLCIGDIVDIVVNLEINEWNNSKNITAHLLDLNKKN